MADDFYKARTAEECFKVLGIKPTQDLKEIKKAYRELAKKYHPDVNPTEKNKFYEVHWAYEMLTNFDFKQKQIRDFTNLNVNIYFTITFEEGFFGKELALNMNPSMMKLDKSDGTSEILIEKFNFTVDPGTSGNKTYTFKGKGIKKGSDIGSLFINLAVNPHPNYRIEGPDVYSVAKVPLIKMIKGGKEEVMTLYGIRTIKIPAGTNPGELIAVKKCGVSKVGKHYFEIQPVFPGREGMQSDNQWNALNIDWNLDAESEEDAELNSLKNIFEDRNKPK
jgi:curved DNA-binding protein